MAPSGYRAWAQCVLEFMEMGAAKHSTARFSAKISLDMVASNL